MEVFPNKRCRNVRVASVRKYSAVADVFLHVCCVDIVAKHLLMYANMHTNGLADSGGARGVMVIVVGKGHSDTSSNPKRYIA